MREKLGKYTRALNVLSRDDTHWRLLRSNVPRRVNVDRSLTASVRAAFAQKVLKIVTITKTHYDTDDFK